jgi:uncharacterized membrane protein
MSAVQEFLIALPAPLWLKIILASMIPIIEARYAILFFTGSMPYWQLFTLGVIGNMLPVPLIIYFFRPLLNFLRKTKLFMKAAAKLEERTHKKAQELQKYSAFGLFIFVALPLPGTGAITGAMIAALLDMREAYALPSIFFGAVVATFITTSGLGLIRMAFGI